MDWAESNSSLWSTVESKTVLEKKQGSIDHINTIAGLDLSILLVKLNL